MQGCRNDTKPLVPYLAIRLSSYMYEHLFTLTGKYQDLRVSMNITSCFLKIK